VTVVVVNVYECSVISNIQTRMPNDSTLNQRKEELFNFWMFADIYVPLNLV